MTGRAAQKAEAIKLVVLDVDGVMTDGTLTYGGATESEWKSFNVKDGLGIKLLQRQGIQVAIITGRLSEAVERRAQELEIKMLVQGREDKRAARLLALARRPLVGTRLVPGLVRLLALLRGRLVGADERGVTLVGAVAHCHV